jgi:hypothetical protein
MTVGHSGCGVCSLALAESLFGVARASRALPFFSPDHDRRSFRLRRRSPLATKYFYS